MALTSIRAQFLTLASGVAIITAATIGAFNYHWAQKAALETAVEALAANTRSLTPQLRKPFEILQEDLQAVSFMPPFQGLARSIANNGVDPIDGSTTGQWRMRLGKTFESILKHRRQYIQMSYIGIADNGLEIVRTKQTNGHIETLNPAALRQIGI